MDVEQKIIDIETKVDDLKKVMENQSNDFAKLSLQIEKQTFSYQSDAKINDFKIEALQRLFKAQEEQAGEIKKLAVEVANMKLEQSQAKGALRMLQYLLGLIGIGGIVAIFNHLRN